MTKDDTFKLEDIPFPPNVAAKYVGKTRAEVIDLTLRAHPFLDRPSMSEIEWVCGFSEEIPEGEEA